MMCCVWMLCGKVWMTDFCAQKLQQSVFQLLLDHGIAEEPRTQLRVWSNFEVDGLSAPSLCKWTGGVGCKCRCRSFGSDVSQQAAVRLPSRCSISNAAFAFLTEEDDPDVFGQAAVDVLGNKVQGRVEMGQHVLLEDLQVFDTSSWLTTKDQSDLHS